MLHSTIHIASIKPCQLQTNESFLHVAVTILFRLDFHETIELRTLSTLIIKCFRGFQKMYKLTTLAWGLSLELKKILIHGCVPRNFPLVTREVVFQNAGEERSSHPEVFLVKGVLKMCSKFTWEHSCRSVISIKLLLQLYWNYTSAWVFSCKFRRVTRWGGGETSPALFWKSKKVPWLWKKMPWLCPPLG